MKTFICHAISFLAKTASVVLVFCLLACLGVTKIMWLNYFPPFMFQYFIGAGVLTLIFALLRNKRWLLLNIATLMITGGTYIEANNLHMPIPSITEEDSWRLNIISFNQLRYNDQIGAFLNRPDVQKADVIVVLEANKHTKDAADKLEGIFPHQFRALGLSSKSMVILSKYPLESLKRERFFADDPAENFLVSFNIRPNQETNPAQIIAAHTKAPIPYRRITERNAELVRLAAVINAAHKDHAVIALGDLNITPYNLNFKTLLKQTGLTLPYGNMNAPAHSWPRFAPWFLRFQIDHMLINNNVTTISFKTLDAAGSDHLPISGDFWVHNVPKSH